ncbi:hypothetical protein BD560DRAFT_326632, partial [Blakeslea trispora]
VEIPLEFVDIIAALVQDSDEHCTVMTHRINDYLSPFQRREDFAHKYDLAIERTIKSMAQKNTYGLSMAAYQSIEHTTPNIPWVTHMKRSPKNHNSSLYNSTFVFIDGKFIISLYYHLIYNKL